jgi:CheY-like chemotaxis protein
MLDREVFRHGQKMEAMGRLAAGVAHDFYNLLTVIQGYSTLLARKPLDPESMEQLNQIAAAANRGAILTRQLLSYSRRESAQFEPLDLNGVVKNLTQMLRRLVGEDIVLETSYAVDVKPVLGDTGMLEQVIMNLVVNARDAMPRGGTLALGTETLHLEPKDLQSHPLAQTGDFACLKVGDTGCGMTDEILSRLFQPFFTTKEPGKGTGLGLATVREIIGQHSGWVEVSSERGKGTEFRVCLPCAPRPLPREQAKQHLVNGRKGKGTILFVEDEERVRKLSTYVLRQHGYNVLEADSGSRALGLWETESSRIDLMVTDIRMSGGVSGWDLVSKLRQKKAGLKVVYTSGHGLGQEHPAPKGTRFLPKPYSPDHLVHAIQEALNGHPEMTGLSLG